MLAQTSYGVTASVIFIENSSYTITLVATADLSRNRVIGAETVTDAIGVSDGEGPEYVYFNAPLVGPDGVFLPAGVIRVYGMAFRPGMRRISPLPTSIIRAWARCAADPVVYRYVKLHVAQGSTDLADDMPGGVVGAGDESLMPNEQVRVQVIITQMLSGLGGFYIQETITTPTAIPLCRKLC